MNGHSRLRFTPEENDEENVSEETAESACSVSNAASREMQRRNIQKQYAAAKRKQAAEEAEKGSETIQSVAENVVQKIKEAAEYVRKHKTAVGIAAAVILMAAVLMEMASSVTLMFEGIGSGIAASTYPSADEDMLAAEEIYCGMEAGLKLKLDRYEQTHDYDEYRYDLDEIEHDPYVLISLVTALHGGEWTASETQDTLKMLFERQYILTEEVRTETRERTETKTGYRMVTDPETGKKKKVPYEYSTGTPYTYRICTVTLENFDLSHLPLYVMGRDEMKLYSAYMATLGNRPDLFPRSVYVQKYYGNDREKYKIPPEALEDEVFAAMIEEAEKYLGYPYVWGGYCPETSFDCSGFTSWVCNNCGMGWDFGRLGSDNLYYMCTPIPASEARPGDLIFFEKTYDTDMTSHVGIYVGDGMMIHAGDPIQYASIETSYWQEHFYGFGRLPRPTTN